MFYLFDLVLVVFWMQCCRCQVQIKLYFALESCCQNTRKAWSNIQMENLKMCHIESMTNTPKNINLKENCKSIQYWALLSIEDVSPMLMEYWMVIMEDVQHAIQNLLWILVIEHIWRHFMYCMSILGKMVVIATMYNSTNSWFHSVT